MTSVTDKVPVEGRHDQALMKAVTELTEQGLSFTELPVEQLARKAGISRATFYLHYRDKSALVDALAYLISDDILTATDHWIRHSHKANWADVHNAMKQVVETWDANATVLRIIFETSTYDERVGTMFADLLETIAQNTYRAIEHAKRTGVVHPEADINTVRMLVHAVQHNCYAYCIGPGRTRAPWLIDQLTHLCWSIIYRPDIVPDKSATLSED